MEINELLTVGNITTIVVWIVNLILPYAASYGLDKDVLTSLVITLIWFSFTVFSSANPNTFPFLGNKIKEAKDVLENGSHEDVVMNDEYEAEIIDEDGC